MAKKILQLMARRLPKRDQNGNPKPGEYCGGFITKVPEGTEKAFYYSGVIASSGEAYSYWAREVSVARGTLRWIDVLQSDYGTTISIYLEQEKGGLRIDFPWNCALLRQITNALMGLANSGRLDGAFLNIQYDVWEKKDQDKRPILGKNGQPKYARAVKFPDVSDWISKEGWDEFVQKNNLKWGERYDTTAMKNVPDPTPEERFWMARIIDIQRMLMQTDGYWPFNYNSITFQAAPHPLGFGNMTDAERLAVSDKYSRVRDNFIFPFSGSVGETSDDLFESSEPKAPHPVFSPPPAPIVPPTIAGAKQYMPDDPFVGVAEPVGSGEDLPF